MEEPPRLDRSCCTQIAVALFKNNIRWRRLTDVAFNLRDILDTLPVTPRIRKLLRDCLQQVLAEVRRWDGKHAEMFVQDSTKRRVLNKSEHLRTFYSSLVWKKYTMEVDDVRTAHHLINGECSNWRLMQFQLACLYAMTDLLNDDWKFDKCRLATFKKQLSDHPVYDFWLTLMESRADVFFDTERRLPNQKLTQCFIFAIRNGYEQLVEFIWSRISDRHREAIGLLEWRAMCFRARDGKTMKFLCSRLCRMNAVGTSRIAWTAYFDTFYRMIHDEKSDVVVEAQFKKKFEFLLQNSCPTLRKRLIRMENYRMVCDAFRYNLHDTFNLLIQYMDPEEVACAREYVDRIFDRKQTEAGIRLRRTMMRRQCTTVD